MSEHQSAGYWSYWPVIKKGLALHGADPRRGGGVDLGPRDHQAPILSSHHLQAGSAFAELIDRVTPERAFDRERPPVTGTLWVDKGRERTARPDRVRRDRDAEHESGTPSIGIGELRDDEVGGRHAPGRVGALPYGKQRRYDLPGQASRIRRFGAVNRGGLSDLAA